MALSFTEQVRRIKADMAYLGYHCISDTTICPGYYLIDEGYNSLIKKLNVSNKFFKTSESKKANKYICTLYSITILFSIFVQ